MLLLTQERLRLAQIDAQIRSLQVERAKIQALLHAYRYPVLSLPNEIMSEAFVHTLPPYPEAPPLFGLADESPRNLLSICSKWKDIALSTPELWRAIKVTEADVHLTKFQRSLKAVNKWLSLSGSLPISFNAEFRLMHDRTEDLLSAISLHRKRWQVLRLEIEQQHLAFISGAAPLLEKLSLGNWRIQIPPTHILNLEHAPRLRAVGLWDIPCTVHSLSWSHLTELCAIEIPLLDWVPMLRQATQVVRCRLSLTNGIPQLHQSVELPLLETLVFEVYEDLIHSSTGRSGLAAFTLPALRRLQVPESFLPLDPIEDLRMFVRRSECNLQTLLIRDDDRGLSSSRAYKAAFPKVTRVSLVGNLPFGVDDGLWKSGEWWDLDLASSDSSKTDEDL
ncbi:hypothetical protein C8F01DRAFT_1135353 [Mycena amicta]|nr:hypothetical protein C8F01DRAFT_1135353 [Mycena amicta]